MAVLYGAAAANAFSVAPPVKSSPGEHGGLVRSLTDTVTYATQTTSDTIVIGGGYLPIGARVLEVLMTTSVTTGSATLALGITGTVAKYKAAGAVTTANVPQVFGPAAALNVPLTAQEQLFLTIAGASLPASGTLVVTVLYVVD
jgi:hypothetical protein